MALIVKLEVTGISTELRYFESEFSSVLNQRKNANLSQIR